MRKIFFIALIAVLIVGFIGINCKSDECCIKDINTQIVSKLEIENVPDIIVESKYSEEDLNLLARLIWSEAGSDWLTDEHQRAVASVVINRVTDSRFPNTIKDVIYQKGQYACVNNGMINQTPNQRAIDNAKYVLDNGVTIPENVIWQSQSRQGKGVWKQIQGHYFCY